MGNSRGAPARPRLWAELAGGLLVFGLYALVAALGGPARQARAVAHARAVYDLERDLWLDIEPWANRALHPHPLLSTLANYEYATTYVLSAFVLLFWLLARRPEEYRPARNSFVLLNVVAIGCFALWPTAPPRLVPDQGFVDTVRLGHTLGSWGSPVGDHANQLAAMPSLHFAWAVWVSAVLARLGHAWWLQVISAAHVLLTFAVIVATGNHYVLDAVAGFALAALCVAVVGRPPPGSVPVPAADAFFLHVETPDAPQVVGGVVLLAAPPSRAALEDVLREALPGLPRFDQRLTRRSPLSAWRWVPAGELDWSWHVVEAERLGLAGLDLDALCSRLAAMAMPRDRPMWRMVSAALPDGRGAAILLAHHACADGVGLVGGALAIFRPRPETRSLLGPVAPAPGAARTAAGVAGLAADTLRGHGLLRLPVGGGHDVATVALPLATVRAAARRQGAGVPDLLLSLLAGALGTLVPRPGVLRISMPLTTRQAGAPAEGNRTGTILLDVPVAPGTRPAAAGLGAQVQALTASGRPAAARAVQRLFGLLPAPLHRLVAKAVYGRGTFGAILSSMPGPRARLTLGGPAVEAVFPLVPLAPGTAVAVGTLTWNGRLCVGIEVDPALAPAATLAAAVAAELASLATPPTAHPADDGSRR
ncbi:MAG TPA: phosphatase PAP2 family protein [Mycobacteriales bacterium]|nr:phosphatase PAP2 family protein [Mycobacteriales bacterium]